MSTPGGPSAKRKPGNAEARNAGQIAGLALVDLRIFLGAVNQRQLFLERHLAEQLVNARVAGDHRHGLCNCRHGHRQQSGCKQGPGTDLALPCFV